MLEENPFLFGKVAAQDRFCNRKKELQELKTYLKDGKNVWLYSPRRFGKTSLVKKVFSEFDSSNFNAAYLDIFDTQSPQDFTLSFVKATVNSISDRIEKVIDFAKKTFSYLAPKIALSDEGKPEIQFGVNSSSLTDVSLDEVMGIMSDMVSKKKLKLVIAIDEFQQISQYENSNAFLAKLRKHIQSQEKIAYVFMGSQRHLMQDIFTSKKKPFYQSAIPFQIGSIQPEELAKSLVNLTCKTNHPFTDDLALKTAQITGGHPYHTEKLASFAYQLFDHISEFKKIDEYLEFVQNQVIEQEESIYKNYFNLLTINQRNVLIAIADFNGKIPSNDMVREYGLSSRQYLEKSLKFLIEKELIDETDNGICIYDLFFKRWLSRKHKK